MIAEYPITNEAFLTFSGGKTTGHLEILEPTFSNHPATKRYVDNFKSEIHSGPITSAAAPTLETHLTNKKYVDKVLEIRSISEFHNAFPFIPFSDIKICLAPLNADFYDNGKLKSYTCPFSKEKFVVSGNNQKTISILKDAMLHKYYLSFIDADTYLTSLNNISINVPNFTMFIVQRPLAYNNLLEFQNNGSYSSFGGFFPSAEKTIYIFMGRTAKDTEKFISTTHSLINKITLFVLEKNNTTVNVTINKNAIGSVTFDENVYQTGKWRMNNGKKLDFFAILYYDRAFTLVEKNAMINYLCNQYNIS